MDANVNVRLLGPFRVERAGKALTAFKSNKVRALLAYLAVEHQQSHHRDVLADLLWPQSSNSSALALLRDALSNLRLLLGDREASPPCIRIVGDTLQYHHHNTNWLDVAELTAMTNADAQARTLKQAVKLYRGEFMEGFSLPDNLDFEAWLLSQREKHRRAIQQVQYRLTTHYLRDEDYKSAQEMARQQVRIDAYAEEAHRQLLRALALNGQRNQALAHYTEYCALLDEELGVKPDVRTTALYQRIRDHQLTPKQTTGYTIAYGTASEKPTDPPTFVGRKTELKRLEEEMRHAQRGEGRVLLIGGEAGSGKSLLVQTFIRRYVAGEPGTVAAWGASNAQLGEGDPYLPFREILRLLTGDFEVPTLRGSLTPTLAQQLEALTPKVTMALRRFGPDLLRGLLPTDKELVTTHDSDRIRTTPPLPAALCDQTERVLSAIAKRCTLVLVFEDLHWADSSTLNMLAHLGRRLYHSRILLIGSYRTTDAPDALTQTIREFQRRWGDITLDLDGVAGREFIDAFLDSMPNALGPSFRDQLYRQTGGHALFTVALIRQLQAEGILTRNDAGKWGIHQDVDWHYLPPQVEAVIAARVARLPENLQEILTVASVEGETFTADVIEQILDLPVDSIQRALSGPLHASQLIEAQGLARIGTQRVARYRFRHSLFQQYLYEQLDPVEQARIHEAIGVALEGLYAERPEAAMRLAYHFEAAGMIEKAVTYVTYAGTHAYRLSAPGEAINLYRRGLALLAQLPHSETRDRQELALQMGLEAPLFAAQGWGAPERAQALDRAYKLARSLKATHHLRSILRALADVNTAQAKHRQALTYAEQLLTLGQETGDRIAETLGYRTTGVSHFFLGHYQSAREYLERGVACYDILVDTAPNPAKIPATKEIVFLWAWLPNILFALGYPEQAVRSSHQALARVQPNGHVHAQAKMLTVAGAAFSVVTGHPKAAIRYADEIQTLATEYRLPAFRGWAMFYRGWGRAALGETHEGLDDMLAGREHLQATGTEASLVQLTALLAGAYAQIGETRKSADTLSEALNLAERTHAHSYLAEMYRLRGELLMTEGKDAESWLIRAIEVAQEQTAKLWELRATASLARLWQRQGRKAEAHKKLAAIYDWFSEGFDMPDLIKAKSLLQALAE